MQSEDHREPAHEGRQANAEREYPRVQSENSPPNTKNYVLLAVLIAQAVGLFFIAFVAPGPDDTTIFLGAAMGLVFGQAVLAAGWFALGWKHRNLGVASLLVLPATAFVLFAKRTGAPTGICMIIACVGFYQFAIMLIPVLLTKRSGWAFGQGYSETKENKLRFEIRHIMIWTAGMAILLSFFRGVAPQAISGEFGDVVLLFLVFTTGCVILSGPLTWTVFSTQHRIAWIVVLLLGLAIVGYLEQYALSRLKALGPKVNWEMTCATLVVYTLTLWSCLLPLRLQGWRLQRAAS